MSAVHQGCGGVMVFAQGRFTCTGCGFGGDEAAGKVSPAANSVSAPTRGGDQSKAANALVAGCLALLALRRVLAWRQNNAPVPIRVGGRIVGLRKSTGPKLPDIFGVLPLHSACPGRLLAAECKAGPHAKLEPGQRKFLGELEAEGALALLVRHVEELDAALRGVGVM